MDNVNHKMMTIAVLAVLCASPAALGWGVMGSSEPDTHADVTGGRMWTTPDTATCTSSGCAINKVYFNGFYGQCSEVSACFGVNPNVAAAGSGIHSSEYQEVALLGVWKDCNKDGYVGLQEQALFEYRSTLLLDASVCPAASASTLPKKDIPAGGYDVTNAMPPHNDGTWVHEFLPIQWSDDEFTGTNGANIDHNPYNVNDNGARVWMDHGAPGSFGLTCYYQSYPAGTFRSTGGLLTTFDCADSYKATDTYDGAATGPLAFTSFQGCDGTQVPSETNCAHDQAHSSSKLNQRNPWGEERSSNGEGPDNSYVEPWNCNAQQFNGDWEESTAHTDQYTGKAGYYESGNALVHPTRPTNGYNVSQPAVPPVTHLVAPSASTSTSSGPVVDDHGYSAAGTMNTTGSGFDQCTRTTDASGYAHNGQTLGGEAYAQETATVIVPYRTTPDDTLTPIEFNRPVAPQSVALGTWAPPNEGIQQFQPDCYVSVCTCICGEDGFWLGNRVWHQETVMPSPSNPSPVHKETYYAMVSSGAISAYNLDLPSATGPGVAPTTLTYGQEACLGATSGVVNNWDCNAADWYRDALGTDISPRSHYLGPDATRTAAGFHCAEYGNGYDPDAGCIQYGSRPGDAYNLIDVDCYDQSVGPVRTAVDGNASTQSLGIVC